MLSLFFPLKLSLWLVLLVCLKKWVHFPLLGYISLSRSYQFDVCALYEVLCFLSSVLLGEFVILAVAWKGLGGGWCKFCIIKEKCQKETNLNLWNLSEPGNWNCKTATPFNTRLRFTKGNSEHQASSQYNIPGYFQGFTPFSQVAGNWHLEEGYQQSMCDCWARRESPVTAVVMLC